MIAVARLIHRLDDEQAWRALAPTLGFGEETRWDAGPGLASGDATAEDEARAAALRAGLAGSGHARTAGLFDAGTVAAMADAIGALRREGLHPISSSPTTPRGGFSGASRPSCRARSATRWTCSPTSGPGTSTPAVMRADGRRTVAGTWTCAGRTDCLPSSTRGFRSRRRRLGTRACTSCRSTKKSCMARRARAPAVRPPGGARRIDRAGRRPRLERQCPSLGRRDRQDRRLPADQRFLFPRAARLARRGASAGPGADGRRPARSHRRAGGAVRGSRGSPRRRAVAAPLADGVGRHSHRHAPARRPARSGRRPSKVTTPRRAPR